MRRSLHVCDASAEQTVRAALAQVAPDDEVVAVPDRLHVGPVWDIEEGGEARIAFWEEVLPPGWHEEWNAARAAAEQGWSRLRTDGAPVVVWHSAHPAEHLLALRVAAHLLGSGVETYEVVHPPVRSSLPAFYSAVSLATPEQVLSLVGSRAPVVDAQARAQEWSRTRANVSTCFRDLTPEGITERPEDAYDSQLLGLCSSEWKRSAHVLGTMIADIPTSDDVLAWRLRTLVGRGVLEGRGTLPSDWCPSEVRLAAAR